MGRVALKDGLLSSIEDAATARLLGGRCLACARVSFPAQTSCPYCSVEGCETVELSSRGVIEVCTTVINRPPGYEGTLPFGLGVVELPEGLRIIARINRPSTATAGTWVRLVLESLSTNIDGHEVITYAFEAD